MCHYYTAVWKFPTVFTYRNLHGFAQFAGDSTALVARTCYNVTLTLINWLIDWWPLWRPPSSYKSNVISVILCTCIYFVSNCIYHSWWIKKIKVIPEPLAHRAALISVSIIHSPQPDTSLCCQTTDTGLVYRAVSVYLRNPSLMGYYSFNRPRRDGWLSWPCWLTDSGRFTHKVVTRPTVSLAQDRESSPARTGVPNHYATPLTWWIKMFIITVRYDDTCTVTDMHTEREYRFQNTTVIILNIHSSTTYCSTPAT